MTFDRTERSNSTWHRLWWVLEASRWTSLLFPLVLQQKAKEASAAADEQPAEAADSGLRRRRRHVVHFLDGRTDRKRGVSLETAGRQGDCRWRTLEFHITLDAEQKKNQPQDTENIKKKMSLAALTFQFFFCNNVQFWYLSHKSLHTSFVFFFYYSCSSSTTLLLGSLPSSLTRMSWTSAAKKTTTKNRSTNIFLFLSQRRSGAESNLLLCESRKMKSRKRSSVASACLFFFSFFFYLLIFPGVVFCTILVQHDTFFRLALLPLSTPDGVQLCSRCTKKEKKTFFLLQRPMFVDIFLLWITSCVRCYGTQCVHRESRPSSTAVFAF